MKILMEILTVTCQFFVWTFVNLLWKPTKWLAVGAFNTYKASRKPKFETDRAASDIQNGAAKHLPDLTKKRDELQAEMKKLSEKWNKAHSELKKVEGAIAVASGDFGQNKKPQNNRNNNNQNKQKQNNQQNQKQNNGNNTPAIGDADFAS